MKKLLLILTVCLALGCKKDPDKTLTQNDWRIESATVKPAMTIGRKTSTNYLELMGPSSCVSNSMISFSSKGTYVWSSNGALCDLLSDTSVKTWKREGDQIFLSAVPNSPMALKGDKLTQTTSTTTTEGIIYTFVFVYKSNKLKILMVCLGNICRSPLAEGIMRHLADERQLNWEIASAGTGNWHIGKAPDHRSIAAAKALGYDISKQQAQQFKQSMFASYDLILVMDRNNLADVISLAKSDEERKKVKLFLDNEEVTDPYWDNALFNPVCRQVEKRCIEIIKQLS